MGGKEEGSNDESSHSKHKIRVTKISIIEEKHSRYTSPTNQVWEKKEDGSNDESSYSKHKTKETQVSIIKEKHFRYTPPTKQSWEKEEGKNDESSHSKYKIKRHKFQSSKKNIQGTHHPLMRCRRKKERGTMMKAAIQNTK